jgi:transcriptional regulator with GAF, ATPase, and Fis domain
MRSVSENNIDVSEKISVLYDVSRVLSEEREIEDIFREILKFISEHLDVTRGLLTLLNGKSGQIFIQDTFGLKDEEIERSIYWLSEGVTGKVVETGEPLVIEKTADGSSHFNKNRFPSHEISFICVPIKSGNKVIGPLSIEVPYRGKSDIKNEVKLLSVIAVMISLRMKDECKKGLPNEKKEHYAGESGAVSDLGLKKKIESIEYDLIVEALKKTGGSIPGASRELKVTERILRLRVNKFKIDPRKFRLRRSLK